METSYRAAETRLRILDAYVAHLTSMYPDAAPGLDRLLNVLSVYRRYLLGLSKPGPLLIRQNLREALAGAIDLFRDIAVNEGARMAGWYRGEVAANCVERLQSLLAYLVFELDRGAHSMQIAGSP